MNHSFDIEIAAKYGINAAILLENIGFWVKQNEANNKNCYDGCYWTFNSWRAYAEMFPYLTQRQIQYALQKLVDEELIKTGNFNKAAYDRTKWYTLTEKGKKVVRYFDTPKTLEQNVECIEQNVECIEQNCRMHSTKSDNPLDNNVQPIPDINPVINPVINSSCSSSDDDGNEEDYFNKLKYFNRNVILSEDQVADLLDQMGLEMFDYYIAKLTNFIDEKGARVSNHYKTLLKWWKEDSGVG
jgi:hypothetical protein